MKHHIRRYHLKRDLNLFTLSLYGIGVIIGAGIYALIGIGAGIAGNAIWISFILAGIIAACSGLSYAELSSMYPKDAAEYNYTKYAFHQPALSFVVGWLMVAAGVISAVVVAFGFAGYFTEVFGGNIHTVSFALILALSALSYLGVRESAGFNTVATIISVVGLLIVIGVGASSFFAEGVSRDFFETPPATGGMGIITAIGIIFFAFIGFEEIVNLSEETKKARNTVPKALLIAVGASTLLYLLVSAASVQTVGWQRLSSTPAPLKEVVTASIPNSGIFFSIIAMFATANTPLILLIVSARILYGMAKAHSMPWVFSKVGKRGTPYDAVFIITVSALALTFLGSLKTLALLTDLSLFLIYAAVNLSVIVLRYRVPAMQRPFTMPLNIGKFPLLAGLGSLFSALMLFSFEKKVLVLGAGAIAAGLLCFYLFRKISGKQRGQNQLNGASKN
ncbi:amino acid permease [Candidatus Woesearchaeota archaeon]|nr:amino acid permease [Candidatus Woesearchaeota archaeon]